MKRRRSKFSVEPSDEALMLRVRAGDRDAFRLLVERHEPKLLRFFYRRTGEPALAEDLTLETLWKIYQARRSYTPRARFTTFLYRVARNHWIDYLRVQGERQARAQSLDQAVEGEERRLGEVLVAPGPPPEAAESAAELRAQIQAGLAALSPGERAVFELAVLDGLRYADVAEILGIPVGTVKSRMHTATRKLRAWLARKGVTP